MVYNGTSSGLNEFIWDPNFEVSTVSSKLRSTEKGTYMAERDIGKIFLKLMLSKEIMPYCGVDISNVRMEE